MKVKALFALMLTLSPALAFAKPQNSGAHMRPQLFHDRTPKAHVHESKPHKSA